MSELKSELTTEEKAGLEEAIVLKESTTEPVDVIALDVMQIHSGLTTLEEANEFIKANTEVRQELFEVKGEVFVITTVVANLNKVNSMIPEDLERDVAIPVQIKITEMLKKAGLTIGIDNEKIKSSTTEE